MAHISTRHMLVLSALGCIMACAPDLGLDGLQFSPQSDTPQETDTSDSSESETLDSADSADSADEIDEIEGPELPRVMRCGDGLVDREVGEACDPNTGTDPSRNDLALAPSSDCNIDCTAASCGDGKTNSAHLPRPGSSRGEECDLGRFCADSNLTPCQSDSECLVLQQSGALLADTACKPRDLPCCTAECFVGGCGDGVLSTEFSFPATLPLAAREDCQATWLPEQCDDGNTDNDDGCDATCKTEQCGDRQITHHPFTRLRALFAEGTPNNEGTGLTYGAEPNTPVTAPEVCDDGKHCSINGKLCWVDADCIDDEGGVIGDGRCAPRNGDGCSADCLSIETCGSGDGFLNDYAVEVFQKGEDLLPVLDPDGQPIVVRSTPAAEVCDDGNNTDGDGCASHCLSTGICGNAVLDTGEDCDYGRSYNGSGLIPDKTSELFCLPSASVPQACELACTDECKFGANPEVICDDQTDNDGDSAVDCNDSDCQFSPPCNGPG